ncbi:hypothetical protein HBB16_09815 [Pseudonocardia sp. MCCB 268]|nr:hypothetical protein [Pseudonocardia cytotoxica]
MNGPIWILRTRRRGTGEPGRWCHGRLCDVRPGSPRQARRRRTEDSGRCCRFRLVVCLTLAST